jgi:tRNA1Val (adenine37-N6)-methyltransferase
MSEASQAPETDAAVAADEGEVTVDTLLRGRVTLLQPVRGFRSSLDPVLLAAFVQPPFGRFVDIGCGTGALAFSLAARDPAATGVGIEIQPRLRALATRGLQRNDFASRLELTEGDVRTSVGRGPLPRFGFDLVATNPPFRVVEGGVVSPDAERAQAHHEVTLKLDEWLDAAATLVKPDGRVAVVFAAPRLADLLTGLAARGLAPRRLRLVHPTLDKPAARVLVEASPGGQRPLQVEPPLVLRGLAGHSDEVRAMLGEL